MWYNWLSASSRGVCGVHFRIKKLAYINLLSEVVSECRCSFPEDTAEMHTPRCSRSDRPWAAGGLRALVSVPGKEESRSEEKFSECLFSKKEKNVTQHKNTICRLGEHPFCFKKQTKGVNGIESTEKRAGCVRKWNAGPCLDLVREMTAQPTSPRLGDRDTNYAGCPVSARDGRSSGPQDAPLPVCHRLWEGVAVSVETFYSIT